MINITEDELAKIMDVLGVLSNCIGQDTDIVPSSKKVYLAKIRFIHDILCKDVSQDV